MASHRSAVRQWRRSLRRNAINRRNKSILRTRIKKLREAIQTKDRKMASKLLPETISIIDKCAKKGTIHENKAARYKSRLSRQVELLSSSSSK